MGLKELITSSQLEFLMEAHNGLSAKIVEEAGFKGIWASSLTISSTLGVRDNNEASWTQIVEICEFMADAVSLPILLDADTGYGNFNNVRRLVKKLDKRRIAGICLEDKLFPKKNSFIDGDSQPLEDIDAFTGKIKSAKDSQLDQEFVVVARTEALITGHGIAEAIKRAEAYRQAGADAILVHSKRSKADEIEEFMQEWGNRHPIIIVPTKYFSTPTDHFRKLGISVVIWANHTLRAAITAMQQICQKIKTEETVKNIEHQIAPVQEIFRLQRAEELGQAELLYLPTAKNVFTAVILAAARGNELGALTAHVPKALLKVNGKTILDTQLADLKLIGINNIIVARGFAKEKFYQKNVTYVDNDQYDLTSELGSLQLALEKVGGNVVILYGDVLFKYYILFDLLNNNDDITIACESNCRFDNHYHDYIISDQPYQKHDFHAVYKLLSAAHDLPQEKITGEFIGLIKCSAKGLEVIKSALQTLSQQENFPHMRICDLFSEVLKQQEIAIKFINGSWVDINTVVSLQETACL